LFLDADIVLPRNADFSRIQPGNLYGARRCMCLDPRSWDEGEEWSQYEISPEGELAGYFHLFHGSDPIVQKRPLYGTRWRHGGGYDSDAEQKWPRSRKVWMPFTVLHLGEPFTNWLGRATPSLDGTVPADADAKRKAMKDMHEARKDHGFDLELLPPT
jgi:hypothetical protein